METKTKTISEGSVPRVASVAANAIITAFDPASGRASVISYADLLAQLRGDLLGGASVGDTEGCIVRLTHFPNYDELVRLGLLDEAEKTKDGPYFKALLAYLKTLGIGKRMLFIGIANPNSQGLALVHIAEVSDTEALPLYSTGLYATYGSPSSVARSFCTYRGAFSMQTLQTMGGGKRLILNWLHRAEERRAAA